MATLSLRSIKGRRMRLRRLSAAGVPLAGACTSLVTEGFIQVSFAPTYQGGAQTYSENIYGEACVIDVEDDTLRSVQVTVQMAEVHPDVLRFFHNARRLEAGGDVVGSTLARGKVVAPVGLEVWTKNVTDGCDRSWGYFQLPWVRSTRVGAPLTIGRSVMNLTVAGIAVPPAGWLPSDEMAGQTFAPGELLAAIATSIEPPAATDGCV